MKRASRIAQTGAFRTASRHPVRVYLSPLIFILDQCFSKYTFERSSREREEFYIDKRLAFFNARPSFYLIFIFKLIVKQQTT